MSSIASEKNKIWEDVSQQVDRLTDRLGMPIDTQIKKVIVGLNVNGIPTVASCGGHVERGRVTFPWVICEAKNRPQYRFSNEKKIKELIAEKYTIKPEHIFDVGNESAEKEWYAMTRNHSETPEYIEWYKNNALLENKVKECVDRFYIKRADINSDSARLVVGNMYPGCVLEIAGADDWSVSVSQEELIAKVKLAQKEIDYLGEYLENNYFSEN